MVDIEALVREVAAQYKVTHLTYLQCEHVLWEHTSYPLGTTNELRQQLHVFFSRVDKYDERQRILAEQDDD